MKHIPYIVFGFLLLISCQSNKSQKDLAQNIVGVYKITQVAFGNKQSLSISTEVINDSLQNGIVKIIKLDKSVIFVQISLVDTLSFRKREYSFFGNLQKQDEASQELIVYDSKTKEKIGLYKNGTFGFNLYPATISGGITLLAKK